MLNTPSNGLNSQADILERLKAVQSSEEPVKEPTEQEEAVSLQDEEVVEETIETESQEEVVYEESVEVEASQTEAQEESDESVYLIGDEEITITELKALKEGSLRQSDYTKKTTELSEQRKVFEGKSEATEKLHTELADNIKALSDSIDSEVESVNWDELADEDPAEYLKKERALKKKSKVLDDARKQEGVLLQQKAADEVNILASKMPSWTGEDGEKNRKADSDLALKALGDLGYTDQDLSVNVDHRFYMLAIKAAKYDALKSKAPAIKKKVARAPTVTPTTRAAKRKVSPTQEARNRLRKSGSDRDAKSAILDYLGGSNR